MPTSSTATTTTTSTTTSSSTATSGVATSRSTITTDAGRIDAEYRAGELEVAVDANPGWTIEVQRRGPTEVEVVWNADGASVHATVVADGTGISSTTRSVHSTT